MKHTNRLVNETSPYLLQHAHNPVDWYPWCDEALQKARSEDKPILVSIGYAACHWCHVMERESFEDERIADVMNAHFVCIKIDREERPDLDHFFMDALQAVSGQGGWPLNMFLTSDGRPFYGGTYFPPRRVQNRLSWGEVLEQIGKAYAERREEVEEQADQLLDHLSRSSEAVHADKARSLLEQGASFTTAQLQFIVENIMRSADTAEGGFGHAPKFPQTFTIQFLLRYGYHYGDRAALDQALLSLRKMCRGGIYDQVGGGFCRYSTDAEWLAPHFEKMTYDNALLLVVLAEAYQITGDEEFKKVAMQTVDFMFREMRSPEGGYYAAIDADSDGEEGKFYTWSLEEFNAALKGSCEGFAELLDVSAGGNWEGTNILRLKTGLLEWAQAQGKDIHAVEKDFAEVLDTLFHYRSKRNRPITDDKIILGWNALFNHALTRAALAFGKPEWLEASRQHMDFMLHTFFDNAQGRWLHTHKNGTSRFPAFLDDLSFLVQSLLALYEATGETSYLNRGRTLVDHVLLHYTDREQCFFYFTPDFQEDVRVRKKEIYDGALPSSNAVMCWNLHRMGILFDVPVWRERSEKMVAGLAETAQRYPTSFGVWNNFLLEQVVGTDEVVILGPGANQALRSLLSHYLPHALVMAAEVPSDDFPLLKGRVPEKGKLTYFACRNYACALPVGDEKQVLQQLLTKQ